MNTDVEKLDPTQLEVAKDNTWRRLKSLGDEALASDTNSAFAFRWFMLRAYDAFEIKLDPGLRESLKQSPDQPYSLNAQDIAAIKDIDTCHQFLSKIAQRDASKY